MKRFPIAAHTLEIIIQVFILAFKRNKQPRALPCQLCAVRCAKSWNSMFSVPSFTEKKKCQNTRNLSSHSAIIFLRFWIENKTSCRFFYLNNKNITLCPFTFGVMLFWHLIIQSIRYNYFLWGQIIIVIKIRGKKVFFYHY